MNKKELREELQNYSKPKLVEMCIKLLEEKEKSLSDKPATYDELLQAFGMMQSQLNIKLILLENISM